MTSENHCWFRSSFVGLQSTFNQRNKTLLTILVVVILLVVAAAVVVVVPVVVVVVVAVAGQHKLSSVVNNK